MKENTFGKRLLKIAVYAMLVFWALVVLFPFYWMLLTSIKSYGSYNAEFIPKFFTLSPTFENYISAFSAVPLAKYFLNTVIFTLVTTALMLVIAIPSAYVLITRETIQGGPWFLVIILIPFIISQIFDFLSSKE